MSMFSRREMMKFGGMGLIGVWGQNLSATPGSRSQAGPSNPVLLLPPADSTDPAVHSKTENMFWAEVMMEHASFFATLMPGPLLATERAQAESFQRSFQDHLGRAKTTTLDRNNYAAFNRSTVELMKPFIEYKQRMLEAQNSGRIRTLVFSLFFGGDVSISYGEVVDFWSAIMSDHSELIAHLLDPQEQELISQALDASAVFQGFKLGNHARPLPGGEIFLATEELIDFETVLEEGIGAGKIKSVIHPILAAHIRRESLKFIDELKRTGNKT
ncbi:MAG: hypothetical protein DMG13_22200 [Acidobacteria bacterium]|nr:MAG: hypothetical protein DMG13_22200 [Acidobacteriota bacterium]